MIVVALRGMAQRKLRSALTAVAILLGVAMIAGTYVTTDQIADAFESIEQTANAGIDAVVTPDEAFNQGALAASETLPESLVARVGAVDGVAFAQGSLYESGALVSNGEPITPSFAPTIVVSAMRRPFDATRVVRGHAPQARDEIAVNRKLFDDEHLRLGERVGVTTRTGVKRVTLVGAFDYGDVASLGGATLVLARLQDMQRWFDRRGEVSSIAASALAGVGDDELARRIRTALPRSVTVRTGEAQARKDADDINSGLGGFLTPALLAFAGAAVLVGAFIIYNTFSITIAQRTREFGVLRALGARRRQLLGAVLAEALVLGVLASLAGLLAGLGFARLLGLLFDAAGTGIPRDTMTLAPRTIVVALGVGIGVTLLAALAPALRATRVAPVAALQEAPDEPRPRRHPRLFAALSALPALGGLALLIVGLFGSAPATSRMAAMAGGAVLVFVGVAFSARHIVRPLASVIGWPLARLFGTPAELARENAMRNPARTAITSAALMIGLGLVVFVAVLAAGLKGSIGDQLARYVSADLIVVGDNYQPLPAGIEDALDKTPGVTASVPMLFDYVEVNDDARNAATDVALGMDTAKLGDVYRMQWLDGDRDTLARLGAGTALIEEQFAKTHHVTVGERFTLTTASGGRATLRAIGEYRDPTVLQGLIVTPAQLRRFSPARDPITYFLRAAPDVPAAQVQAAVEHALKDFPIAKVQSQLEYREAVEAQLDQLVYLLYALLAMSVVISLFGIANNLFLSIHERTRELGMLRAIGATRRQLRRVVRYESVITAVLGGTLGVVIGVLFGFLMTQSLDEYDIGLHIPVVQLVVFALASIVVGVIAAIAPARRGASIRILDAIHHE